MCLSNRIEWCELQRKIGSKLLRKPGVSPKNTMPQAKDSTMLDPEGVVNYKGNAVVNKGLM